ncbi:MAG: DNA mismatch repair protein MutS [Thermaerobacter sp.]|nr:DNA mismatch repair protein MutS [Thermaerobacter sp.]
MSERTPLMQQYDRLKAENPGALLFFRLGDFYELFGEDAQIAAPLLEIVLTSRDQKTPMCGVPYHAAEGYIGRLVEGGYRVAVCEQTEDPATAKGLVRREVVRVVTAATYQADGDDQARWLGVLVRAGAELGLGLVDLGHGRFRVATLRGEDQERRARRELQRAGAAELLLSGVDAGELTNAALAPLPSAQALHESRGELGEALLRLPPAAQEAALLGHAYLAETQRGALSHLEAPRLYEVDRGLGIDPATRRNLELVQRLDGTREGTLLWVLDETRSALGRRLLREWVERPLLEREEIVARHDAVGVLLNEGIARARLREALSSVRDLERLLSRAGAGQAGPRDYLALGQTLQLCPDVAEIIGSMAGELLPKLTEPLGDALPVAAEVLRAIADDPPASAREGGFVRAGFDAEIDRLREAQGGAKDYLAGLERTAREVTGIRSLKVGFNKVFGYYIEVSRANVALVPPDWERRQTTANAERYVTADLRRQEELILRAERELVQREGAVLEALRQTVLAEADAIRRRAAALAALDCLQSFAEVARRRRYVRPEMREEPVLDLQDARHPVVEALLPAGEFVANDTALDARGTRLSLITGPNMGGKSTYLRQVALLQVMAQAGSFVPAKRAQIGLADRVFTRVGASDDLSRGVSTFMAEMLEVSLILREATARSLVVLDEVGRGTGTADGVAIAAAVAEYLASVVRCRALVATHYLELCALAEEYGAIRNHTVAVAEEGRRVVFLHRIVPGAASRSYGLDVARLAGLPEAVLGRAEQRLRDGGTPRPAPETHQLALFPVAPHPALLQLQALDPLRMTPLEALVALSDLKRLAEEED